MFTTAINVEIMCLMQLLRTALTRKTNKYDPLR